VIAATNRDLAEEVQRGNFRLDLYYRLNVITLKIPPLRKHLEDLPALIDHFIRQGGHRKRVAPEVLDAMKAHRWPGNVRELENCVARLVALSADDLLHVEDLWIGGETSVCGDKRSIGERDDSASNDRALRKIECSSELNNIRIALGDFERNAIKRALDVVDGSPVRAAKMLGISRTTLYRKLKSYEGKNISK
jgi:DNA-binding NtrC family response regulator